ncbi:hypothetical protein BDV97DRAFT_66258, partial [Delphinella strobiligena]
MHTDECFRSLVPLEVLNLFFPSSLHRGSGWLIDKQRSLPYSLCKVQLCRPCQEPRILCHLQ